LMQITSRDNSLLRQARAVRDGKDDDFIFVEGLRLCVEALRSKLELEAVIFSEQLARKEHAVEAIAEISRASRRVGSVSEKLLESISYTKTPQGIVVLARRPESSEQRLAASLTNNPLLVVLHQINNPVNVGAILRTAEPQARPESSQHRTRAIRFPLSRCEAQWVLRFVCPSGGTRSSPTWWSGAAEERSVSSEPPPAQA
jgi:hypothetical protein